MNIKVVIACLSLLMTPALAACSDDDAPADVVANEDAAKSRAVTFVGGGTAATSERVTENGVSFFHVDVTMPNGATIEVEILPNGDLRELKDFKGPFDYTVAAIPGVLTLEAARAKALEAKAGSIVAWKYEVEEGKKQYEFYVRDVSEHLFEIKIDGISGAIDAVVEKAAID